uniref:Uncharacterized protein n=1 Tax=Arundo donax TaxID=35708 RepID=A0A0A9H9C8_ARUDO
MPSEFLFQKDNNSIISHHLAPPGIPLTKQSLSPTHETCGMYVKSGYE